MPYRGSQYKHSWLYSGIYSDINEFLLCLFAFPSYSWRIAINRIRIHWLMRNTDRQSFLFCYLSPEPQKRGSEGKPSVRALLYVLSVWNWPQTLISVFVCVRGFLSITVHFFIVEIVVLVRSEGIVQAMWLLKPLHVATNSNVMSRGLLVDYGTVKWKKN